MSKDVIEIEGTILESMPNAMFKVKLENGHEIFSSHLRQNKKEFHKNFTG